MDGPRVLKLKSAFEKMVSQLFTEAEIEESIKEEINSLFTQVLLKYSIPCKLNELDALLQRQPQTLYDVTCPNTISNILSSYITEPVLDLESFIDQETKSINTDLSALKEKERQIDQSLEHFTAELNDWLKTSENSLSKIKKEIQ